MRRPAGIKERSSRAAARKDDLIQIRASAETKALLNRAAVLRGQKLSEFMLDSARRHAEETLLDQRSFFLDPEAHAKFLAMSPDARARVIGCYAISTAMEQRVALPSAKLRRGMPEQAPLLLIGRLAVDQAFQGMGLGGAIVRCSAPLPRGFGNRGGAGRHRPRQGRSSRRLLRAARFPSVGPR